MRASTSADTREITLDYFDTYAFLIASVPYNYRVHIYNNIIK